MQKPNRCIFNFFLQTYKKLAQTFKDTQCLENTLEYAVEGLNADHNGILRLMKSGQLFDWDKVVEHKTENPFYRLLRTGSNNMNAIGKKMEKWFKSLICNTKKVGKFFISVWHIMTHHSNKGANFFEDISNATEVEIKELNDKACQLDREMDILIKALHQAESLALLRKCETKCKAEKGPGPEVRDGGAEAEDIAVYYPGEDGDGLRDG